ncbi:hypothetical protein J2W40_003524 [Sphingobium xenophagum]|uniref:Uncharacterized protein n=1 Tax=Sphingobium xenophagum TaxID=121428 RepID=A0ABU1X517_SPHXE|nr:hypothetical protein [Sphingobium xenophagum]
MLPDGDFIEHRVRQRADEIGRHIDAVRCPVISRVLMPRAYIDTIFSSKPGKRR